MTSFDVELRDLCITLGIDQEFESPGQGVIVAAAILTAGSWIADSLTSIEDGASVGDKLRELSWEAEQCRLRRERKDKAPAE